MTAKVEENKKRRGRPPGQPKSGGRKKGSANIATKEVKDALLEAFDRLGGISGLVEWGEDNKTEFYKLWTKLLPHQIHLAGAAGKDLFQAFAEQVKKEATK